MYNKAMKKRNTITIGMAAKQAEVNIQTLRYYERRNLLKPVARKESGYRVYDDESISRLRFIKFAQELGFSLKDIKELLALRGNDKSACAKTKARAQKQLAEVESRILQLEQMRDTLKGLIGECEKNKLSPCCPILIHFERESKS